MKTLKELQKNSSLTQTQLAYNTGVDMNQLSRYKKGFTLPNLEDAIALENYFDQHINWYEPINNKHNILKIIITLSNHYPLQSVLNFTKRSLKTDAKKNLKSGETLQQLFKTTKEATNESKK